MAMMDPEDGGYARTRRRTSPSQSYDPGRGPMLGYRDPPMTDGPDPDPSYDAGRGGDVRFGQLPRNTPPPGGYRVPGMPEANAGINPKPTTPQPAGGFDFSTPDGIRAYYASRGVTPRATSPDYWAGKWQEFGQRDPEYFQRFLSNAEEFTGGPQQTAQAMWGRSGGASGGMQGGGLGFLLQLLGSRLQAPQAVPQFSAPPAPQAQTPGLDIEAIIRQALGRAF